MTIIDRYILGRFLANFAILFVLLFCFAVAIDMILALDSFVEAAKRAAGNDAGSFAFIWQFIRSSVDFEAPRFFQFYAFLHGLVAIGAMGFTLSQMHRHKELVAMLAAGVSLHRVAMPFIVGAFLLSLLQLVNQELFLPRVAPMLLRNHGQIGRASVEEFEIRFTPDGRGSLFQAASFDPRSQLLSGLTILERDTLGRTSRRITADSASWKGQSTANGGSTEGWQLTNGFAIALNPAVGDSPAKAQALEPITFYPTDLSPGVLTVRKHGEYATMLGLGQISEMLNTPGIAEQTSLVNALLRYRFSRFSAVLVNVLVMWMALPAFLLRQPANLLMRTLLCAAIALPALLGSAIFMMMDLPGISPAVGVFLPVAIFLPIVLAQWTYLRT